MQIPLQITYRDMEPSDALNAYINEKVARLEQFANTITSMRVTIASPHKHQNKGRLFAVSIDIVVPGQEIVASHSPDKDHSHEDAYVCFRDAFNAALRQLEDYNNRRKDKGVRRTA